MREVGGFRLLLPYFVSGSRLLLTPPFSLFAFAPSAVPVEGIGKCKRTQNAEELAEVRETLSTRAPGLLIYVLKVEQFMRWTLPGAWSPDLEVRSLAQGSPNVAVAGHPSSRLGPVTSSGRLLASATDWATLRSFFPLSFSGLRQMMKGYKVTDKSRRKLVGVACESLSQLMAKGSQKLGIEDVAVAALDDGTIVDDEDYFRALPSQTIIILYRKGEDIITGVDVILNVLRRVNNSYLETGSKAKDFVMEKTKEIAELLRERQKEEEEGLALKNTPQEDPDWFEGLETNARTKEEFMFRKSQDRIRCYFYKFREDVRKSQSFALDPEFRRIGQECLEFLKRRLKEDEYFGCYFDRRCAAEESGPPVKRAKKARGRGNPQQSYDKLSYCDPAGKFVCQGKWKLESCEFLGDHQINPYLSKEARILFSTWNLDHRIERSRSVVPTLEKAIRGCGKSRSVNFLYFYQLLFTKFNLKLVHVVCHDKSVHEVSCDPRFLYT